MSLELVSPSSVLCFLASFISDTAINAVGLASGVRRASEHNAPFTEFTDDDGDAAADNLEAAMSNKDKKEKCRVPKYAVIERCAASPGPWYAFNDSLVESPLLTARILRVASGVNSQSLRSR